MNRIINTETGHYDLAQIVAITAAAHTVAARDHRGEPVHVKTAILHSVGGQVFHTNLSYDDIVTQWTAVVAEDEKRRDTRNEMAHHVIRDIDADLPQTPLDVVTEVLETGLAADQPASDNPSA